MKEDIRWKVKATGGKLYKYSRLNKQLTELSGWENIFN